MYNQINNWLVSAGVSDYVSVITIAILSLIAFFLCLIIRAILKYILIKISTRTAKISQRKSLELAVKNAIPQKLANMSIPIVIHYMAIDIPSQYTMLETISGLSGVIVFLMLFNSLAKTVNDVYIQHEISKIRPIKGVIQVIQVAVYIVCGIISLAIVLGTNFLALLGGIGAIAAVLSFVFKDPILGFVAGIQLTANDMLRIGDWIEAPKYLVDGDVLEISMTTVKVQNFDKSITSIPTYSLVSDAFINWRGMSESGGRRIKRSIYIDASKTKLCNEDMIKKFKSIDLIKDYIEKKMSEIESYNTNKNGEILNSRMITNIGTFREYIRAYLSAHPGINKDMTIIVRQLSVSDSGIPLEIYAFTSTTDWGEYESIQSDIFDHFYSAAKEFELEVYQKPSGSDLRLLSK